MAKRRKTKSIGCAAWVLLGIAVLCGGGLFLAREAKQQADAKLAEADRLFGSGKRAEAVELYKEHHGLADSDDQGRILQRVIRYELDRGHNADKWAEKAARLSVASDDQEIAQLIDKAKDDIAKAKREAEKQARRSRSVGTGEIGVVDMGEAVVWLGATEEAYGRLTELSIAKDAKGISQMALQGRVLVVPRNTRVRVIGSGILISEVRIEEGELDGRSGFIAPEFIKQP